MIGTLLLRHLRHQRVLLLVLLTGMVGFEVMIIHIGSAIDESGMIPDLVDSLPAFLKNLIETQIGDLSFPAFPAFGFEHPATLGCSLAYIVFVATTPAGERDSGMLDLLLARPLSRRQYLSASVLHLVGAAVAIPGCLLTGTALGLWTVEGPNELPWTRYISGVAGLSALLLAWGGIALFLAAGSKRRGSTIVLMVGALAVTFLLHVLGQMSTSTDAIEWLSPFRYFNPVFGSVQGKPWIGDACLLCGVFAVTTIGAFVRFEKRDL